ncbi:Hypothetical protein FKW44_010812 [Caligus rogercresseyi]|uniref:Uncharacterized protein n=1 Tax=Caligus rogercresseyi TaxID=217165 RepID=A0A7T8K9U2_CALRO|nr:Hypothetical protein FKW44_010812 [Caligus rogercresseyi]
MLLWPNEGNYQRDTDKLNEATSVKPLIDSLKEGTDQDVSTAAVSLGHTFASLNRSAKNRVNRHLVGAIEQLRIKLDKDIAMFTQLGELGLVSHTEKLAWSNTPTEASFATLKYFDLSKSTMKLGNIVQLTIGHVNRIAEWMTDCDTTPAERKELLDASSDGTTSIGSCLSLPLHMGLTLKYE